jgi:glycosyltransferase involved in cell wall biosynthesis
MKIALGMIVGNKEGEFLKKHLPILSPKFDTCIAVASCEDTDPGLKALFDNKVNTVQREWNNNFSDARNAVIEIAEDFGMDALLMLDADEVMFPEDIDKIKELLESHQALKLPRYEFGPTKEFYNPTLYPDYQGRAFQLNKGYHYRNKVHELLYQGEEEKCVFEKDGFYASSKTHIYHYGRCKALTDVWLKYHNDGLIMDGKEPLTEIPAGAIIEDLKDVVNWDNGQQPL